MVCRTRKVVDTELKREQHEVRKPEKLKVSRFAKRKAWNVPGRAVGSKFGPGKEVHIEPDNAQGGAGR